MNNQIISRRHGTRGQQLLSSNRIGQSRTYRHASTSEQRKFWYNIVKDVASALHYLHDEYDQRVVHRDLKASNIMLVVLAV